MLGQPCAPALAEQYAAGSQAGSVEYSVCLCGVCCVRVFCVRVCDTATATGTGTGSNLVTWRTCVCVTIASPRVRAHVPQNESHALNSHTRPTARIAHTHPQYSAAQCAGTSSRPPVRCACFVVYIMLDSGQCILCNCIGLLCAVLVAKAKKPYKHCNSRKLTTRCG